MYLCFYFWLRLSLTQANSEWTQSHKWNLLTTHLLHTRWSPERHSIVSETVMWGLFVGLTRPSFNCSLITLCVCSALFVCMLVRSVLPDFNTGEINNAKPLNALSAKHYRYSDRLHHCFTGQTRKMRIWCKSSFISVIQVKKWN